MLGCDIIETERIKAAYEKMGEKFLKRVLTDREREIFDRRNGSLQFLAGRWAAKESISKSFKTGIGKLAFKDIEILNDEKGAPEVYIRSERREDIEVSISHDRNYSIAVSLLKG